MIEREGMKTVLVLVMVLMVARGEKENILRNVRQGGGGGQVAWKKNEEIITRSLYGDEITDGKNTCKTQCVYLTMEEGRTYDCMTKSMELGCGRTEGRTDEGLCSWMDGRHNTDGPSLSPRLPGLPSLQTRQYCCVYWTSMFLVTSGEDLVTAVLSWKSRHQTKTVTYLVRWEQFPDTGVTASLITHINTVNITLHKERVYRVEITLLGPSQGILAPVSNPVIIDTRNERRISPFLYIILWLFIITVVFCTFLAIKLVYHFLTRSDTLATAKKNNTTLCAHKDTVINVRKQQNFAVLCLWMKLRDRTELEAIV